MSDSRSSTAANSSQAGPRARRWPVALALLGLCLVTLAAKWWVNTPRIHVNHGDISFYLTVARNLAEGRGFVIDYVWNFWGRPEGIPTPSNVWWMPLPSVIAAVGMKLGSMDYRSAQAATIVFSSLLPIPVYLLGRSLFDCRRVGLIAASLSTTFHLFLDQPSAPLSHCPYVVLAPLALWAIHRACQDPRRLGWVGAAIAATQLARSDGILLFATLGGALLIARVRPKARHLALLVLGYALVMSPWWVRNVQDFGVMQPGGSLRSAVMSEYLQWYSLPESVTLDTWLADGWEPVLDHKARIGQNNLYTLATGMVSGAAARRRAWEDPVLLGTMALAWLGLLSCFRRRFAFLGVHAAAEWAFYSLVFTAVGNESFRSGMYSLYPFLMVAAARGLQILAHGAGFVVPRRRRARVVAVLLTLGVLGVIGGQLLSARQSLERKAAGIDQMHNSAVAVRRRVIEPLGLADKTFLTVHAHDAHAMMGLRCVGVPYEPEPVIREVARKYGATHLLMLGEYEALARPGLAEVDTSPHWHKLFGPARIGLFEQTSVYELRHGP